MINSNHWFDFLKITLASPTQIKKWGIHQNESNIVFGEIKTEELILPNSLKPSPNGLFCEKIFGPLNPDECSCGGLLIPISFSKLKCLICNLKYDSSVTRKYRMGYITLSIPVVHIWYLSGITSYISLLLNISSKNIKKIIYLSDINSLDKITQNLTIKFFDSQYYNNVSGTIIIQELLNKVNLKRELFRCRLMLYISTMHDYNYNFPITYVNNKLCDTRENLLKRIRLIENFISTKTKPTWMILNILPVIPPLLRPLLPDNNSQLLISDFNKLYLNIIKINNKLLIYHKYNVPRLVINNECRQLQESVDLLIDNGVNLITDSNMHNTNLNSLSKTLQGKTGRFRYNLLGKRVNYSGRSVIVVGPFLKLNQCGLPFKIAIELFEPFLIRQLIRLKVVETINNAKNLLKKSLLLICTILQIIVKHRLIILNRAPTLHRLSIQAFEPIIINSDALMLHPLICTSFNADFDGDQISVHIPLTLNSQREAKKTLYINNNFLSATTGLPNILPSHDMILGYNILSNYEQILEKNYFKTYQDIITAYEQQQITLYTVIWVKTSLFLKLDDNNLELQFNNTDRFAINKYFSTTLGRIILNKKVYDNLEL